MLSIVLTLSAQEAENLAAMLAAAAVDGDLPELAREVAAKVLAEIATAAFVLEPLGPQHNEDDYEAWSTSMEHIRATPGFRGRSWPHEMTLEENRADLEMHARHFAERRGFTYTVLDAQTRKVIGCLYIYPVDDGEHDARARSWVRADRAELDAPLWRAVSEWLAREWPFARVEYAAR